MKTRKLADEIADRIREWILQGILRPGDRLQSERQLAEALHTSRPTIREALASLEDEGLLQLQRGGLYVPELTSRMIVEPLVALFESDPASFDDYLEFRAVVESEAAYFAALRATDVDRDSIRATHEAFLESHTLGDPAKEAEADAAFHVAIYEACHNLAILHIMRGTVALLRSDVLFNRSRLYARVGYREATIAQHAAIHDAIISGDPETARAAARAHITFVRQSVEELKLGDLRNSIARRRRDGRQGVVQGD